MSGGGAETGSAGGQNMVGEGRVVLGDNSGGGKGGREDSRVIRWRKDRVLRQRV